MQFYDENGAHDTHPVSSYMFTTLPCVALRTAEQSHIVLLLGDRVIISRMYRVIRK